MAEPPFFSSQGSQYEQHQILPDQENLESSPLKHHSSPVLRVDSQKPKKLPRFCFWFQACRGSTSALFRSVQDQCSATGRPTGVSASCFTLCIFDRPRDDLLCLPPADFSLWIMGVITPLLEELSEIVRHPSNTRSLVALVILFFVLSECLAEVVAYYEVKGPHS